MSYYDGIILQRMREAVSAVAAERGAYITDSIVDRLYLAEPGDVIAFDGAVYRLTKYAENETFLAENLGTGEQIKVGQCCDCQNLFTYNETGVCDVCFELRLQEMYDEEETEAYLIEQEFNHLIKGVGR